MPGHINTKLNESVLIIEIDRPSKLNALTQSMYREFSEAFENLQNQDEIAVALIHGKGGCFTAGNDLSDFINSQTPDDLKDVQKFLEILGTLEKPLIAAVEGPAVGIGSTLMPHCDLAYASKDAYFQMPFVDIGICVEGGSSVLLPHLIGKHRANEFLLLGDRVSAEKAARYGLINEVVEGNVFDYALEKAKIISQKPREALLATKKLLKHSPQENYQNIVSRENEILFKLLHSDTCKQRLQSILK